MFLIKAVPASRKFIVKAHATTFALALITTMVQTIWIIWTVKKNGRGR